MWFTRAVPAVLGDPVIVSGLTSTGGSEIVLSVPPEAGPGDLLVKIPGGAHWTLSNAFPFDPTADPCPAPKVYGTAKINSSGLGASIGWTGSPSLKANDFKITLRNGPPGEKGLVFWGASPKAGPFYGGWMLVSRPQQRGRRFTIGTFGFATAPVPIGPGMVGSTRYYQCWYQDAFGTWGVGTSDALKVTFCP